MVQLGEGLRVHHPGRRRERRLRPLLGNLDERLPQPGREPAGRVRDHAGPEGTAGGEHPSGLSFVGIGRRPTGRRPIFIRTRAVPTTIAAALPYPIRWASAAWMPRSCAYWAR